MGEKVNIGVHINDLFLWCNDINDIRNFYTDILGLKETWIDLNPKDTPAYVVYKMSNNQALHFLKLKKSIVISSRWSYQSSSEIEKGIEQLSWTLEFPKDKVNEIFKKLKENNITVYQEKITARSGYSAITVLDPMGNTIDIYYLH